MSIVSTYLLVSGFAYAVASFGLGRVVRQRMLDMTAIINPKDVVELQKYSMLLGAAMSAAVVHFGMFIGMLLV